jgi:hypothetical protein
VLFIISLPLANFIISLPLANCELPEGGIVSVFTVYFLVGTSSVKVNVVGRIMAPKEVFVLVPETCEHLSFADVIKIRILRWGDYPGSYG